MYNIADKMIAGCKFDFAIFAILTLQIPIVCFDMLQPDPPTFSFVLVGKYKRKSSVAA